MKLKEQEQHEIKYWTGEAAGHGINKLKLFIFTKIYHHPKLTDHLYENKPSCSRQ